jgi:hypothetical protein
MVKKIDFKNNCDSNIYLELPKYRIPIKNHRYLNFFSLLIF